MSQAARANQYPAPFRHRAAGPGDGERRHRRTRPHGATYKSGDIVPETGIYEVVHLAGHRMVHEVVLHAENFFPECETCRANVRFRVVRTAPYVFDDEDFEPEG